MQPYRCGLLLLVCLAVIPSGLAAQETSPSTTIVEILGLRTWTRQMVEDSVQKYQPGISLADHSCAVVLRDSVGFADAAAQWFSLPDSDTTWVVLPVVEPRQRELVRFRTYTAERPPVQEWADLFQILEQFPRSMNPLQAPEVLFEGAGSFSGTPLPEGTRELRRRLKAHATPRDWELARDAILTDSSYTNRTVAALVLSNFPERDSTFYLLVEGLRTTDRGAEAADMILSALVRGAPPRIDWMPARDALAALVSGTNLFAYTKVLDALVVTQIDPALGRELALLNPDLLLDHLGAKNPFTPPPAHRFLVHIRGQDLGRDPADWQAWLSAS